MQKPRQTFYIPLERRRFLKSLALVSAGFTVPSYLAEALTLTPQVTQGPFYPLAANMPLDDDNDLAFYNDNVTAAAGQRRSDGPAFSTRGWRSNGGTSAATFCERAAFPF
jgi:hypothetical protein